MHKIVFDVELCVCAQRFSSRNVDWLVALSKSAEIVVYL